MLKDIARPVEASVRRVDRAVPVATIGGDSERYQGRNLALRLAACGYTNVY
jgi:hypothetical protein